MQTNSDKQIISQPEIFIRKKNNGALIDAVLVFVVSLSILYLLPVTIQSKLESPITPGLFIFIAFGLYRLVALLFFKETIGMHICKSKLLNGSLKPLSKKENFLAAFFILINGVDYYQK